MPRIRSVLTEALELVLPVSCAGCGRWDVPLCPACRALLPSTPTRCDADIPMLDRDGAALLPTWAIGRYAGPLRTLVLAWKNHRRTDVAPDVRSAASVAAHAWAPLLAATAGATAGGEAPAAGTASGEALAAGTTSGEAPAAGVTGPAPRTFVVVPAPSGWRRRWQRRFVVGDLADAVGQGLARGLDPGDRVLVVDLLRRRAGRGAHQSGRGARGRSANRSGSVRVVAAPPQGAVVVLVDDVVTTGATLASCRDALAAQGVAVAGALVLAATPAPAHRTGRVRLPGGAVTARRPGAARDLSRPRRRDRRTRTGRAAGPDGGP